VRHTESQTAEGQCKTLVFNLFWSKQRYMDEKERGALWHLHMELLLSSLGHHCSSPGMK
jgi:hypothetical protein